ncbi:MAG: hypothetical protein ACYC09_04480 [Bacteroidota bacterium]
MSEEIKQYGTEDHSPKTTIQRISYVYQNTFWGRWFNVMFSAFVLFVANGLFDKPTTAIFTTAILIIGILLVYSGKKNRNEISRKVYFVELSFFIMVSILFGLYLFSKASNEETQFQKLTNENTILKDSVKSLNDSIQTLYTMFAVSESTANINRKNDTAIEKASKIQTAPFASVVSMSLIHPPEVGKPLGINLNVLNSGHSPAYNFSVVIHSIWGTHQHIVESLGKKIVIQEPITNKIIPQNIPYVTPTWISADNITDEFINNIKSINWKLIVRGKTYYTNKWNERFETPFYFSYVSSKNEFTITREESK